MRARVRTFNRGHFFLLVLDRLAWLHTFVLVDDFLKQVRRVRGVQSGWVVLAWFGKGFVFSLIKLFRCGLDFGYPGVEFFLARRDRFEFHAGEASAAIVGGDAVHFSFLVGNQ